MIGFESRHRQAKKPCVTRLFVFSVPIHSNGMANGGFPAVTETEKGEDKAAAWVPQFREHLGVLGNILHNRHSRMLLQIFPSVCNRECQSLMYELPPFSV